MAQPKFEIGKFKYLLLGVVYSIVPFGTLYTISYLNLAAIINGWLLFITGIICILYFLIFPENKKFINMVTFAGLIFITVQFFLVIANLYGNATTDEIIIETYAAKIFLQGKDPYVNSNMVEVFKFITPIFGTPMLNGNNVYFLLYPGMSVLAFVPFVYLNLPDYTALYFFSILLLLFTVIYLKKNNMADNIPYLTLIVAMDIAFVALSLSGSTDVIFMFFMTLSYIYRKNTKFSGAMYGLAISAKQLPIIALPFMLYLIYREKGKSMKHIVFFILGAIFTFLLTNLPFILMQPHDWMRNMIEAEFQPIIGIGVGFSEIAFAGFVNIPSKVFTILFLTTALICMLVYIRFYDRIKYALFVFPAIIFLFNFRLLTTYIFDWIILDLLAYVDFYKEKEQTRLLNPSQQRNTYSISSLDLKKLKSFIKKNSSFLLVLIIIFAGGASAVVYESMQLSGTHIFVINSVSNVSDPIDVSGYITSMDVSITYNPASGMNLSSPVFFRIIPSTSTGSNFNSLIWRSNHNINYGMNNVTITPTIALYFLPDNSNFRIQAYYNFQSLFYSSGTVSLKQNTTFPNYGMMYPTYTPSNPYPGWTLNQGEKQFSYILKNGLNVTGNGANMSLINSAGTSSMKLTDEPANLTYLSTNNKILRFDGNYTGEGTILSIKSGIVTPVLFYGINITFNNTFSIFVGFNSTAKNTSVYDSINSIYIITSNFTINFRQIYNLSLSNVPYYPVQYITFSYEIRSQLPGTYDFSFYNLSLN